MRFIWIGLALAACSGEAADPCPRVPLEVRAFTGDSVEGSTMACRDGRGWCERQEEPPQVSGSGCGAALSVIVSDPFFSGGRLSIHFELDDADQVTSAFAISAEGCDTSGCEWHYWPATGWVMPEETSTLGRVRGRYSLAVDDGYHSGVSEGEYDVPAF